MREQAPSDPKQFVKDYGSWVTTMVYRVIQRREIAEEAASTALLKAWECRADFDGRSSFKTWLTRIAINAAVDAARRERVQSPRHPEPIEAAEDVPDHARGSLPQEQIEKQETVNRIQTALSTLDEIHRSVIVLREWEGLSYSEIASVLGCPIGTVMSRLSHARRALKGKLEKIHD